MGETVAVNRKARHEYTIEDTLEAGLVLTGTEIKSIRAGKVNLSDAHARVERDAAAACGRDAPRGPAAAAGTTRRVATASCCCIASRSTSCWVASGPRV